MLIFNLLHNSSYDFFLYLPFSEWAHIYIVKEIGVFFKERDNNHRRPDKLKLNFLCKINHS